MTRLMTIAFVTTFPVMAAAQGVPPVPPTPPAPMAAPAPAAAPTPPTPPAPPRAPRAATAASPMSLDSLAMQDALHAASDHALAQLDARAMNEQVREATAMAREAARMDMDAMRVTTDRALTEARMNMNMNFEYQDRAFAVASTFGQDSDGTYASALSAYNSRQYDRAVVQFDRVIAQKGPKTDGALYWKAFSQYRLARSEDALATLALLRKDYAQSRYLPDARVLEADVRKLSGQNVDPASLNDDDIKLLAIQGLQNSDQAVPLLEGVLSANNSLAVKKRALYSLALRDDAKAHAILLSYAKGKGNPDLQNEAIRYIATRRDSQTTGAELREIYESTQDVAIRRAIIDAYRSSSDKVALISIASTNGPIDLRKSALNGLSNLASPQEIWTLYQKEQDKDLRLQMVSVLSSMGAVDQLSEIVKVEKDEAVKLRAIRSLGGQKTDRTGTMLVGLYSTSSTPEARRAVIDALGSQNNAEGLVSIARKETSLDLKMKIVERLSDMARNGKSKVAADYLMEIVK